MSEIDLPGDPPPPVMTAETAPPPVVDEAPAKPHPRVVSVWRIAWTVAAAVLSLGFVVLAFAVRVSMTWALPPAIFLFAFALWFPGARWRAWSYRVGAVDVRMSHGVLWRTSSVVPHARIQHVDTSQGPIDRAFGLARVVVYTAGSVGAVEAIPGLLQADAEALRDRLAALSGTEDAL
jgi:membrane protein YdbS with pleckstrin-like domain